MSIRYKIILTLGIISIGIGFLNMGLARRFILPSFLKIETDLAQTNVERVIEAYDNKFEYLSSKISDWANWDDTYNFIIDKKNNKVFKCILKYILINYN